MMFYIPIVPLNLVLRPNIWQIEFLFKIIENNSKQLSIFVHFLKFVFLITIANLKIKNINIIFPQVAVILLKPMTVN